MGRLIRHALREGPLGGSRFWTVVAALGLGMRVLRRLTRSTPQVAFCEPLGPGQALLITHEREPAGSRRRR